MSFTRSASSGLVTGASIGGLAETWTYNSFGEPESHTVAIGATTIYEVAYSYDTLGRVDTRVETIDGITTTLEYFYDLGGRLVEVLEDGATVEAYTYDDNDNRTSAESASGTILGTYDGQDRLTAYGATTYAYDDAGDLVSSSQPGGTATYDYDGLGNLRTVVLADGTTIEYVIDASGRRIGKRVGGLLLQGFLYKDDLNPVAELDGAGQIVTLFVYGGHPNVPDYMIRDGFTYRIISDRLGSPRLVVDVTTGQVAGRIDYDAFGRITAETSPGLLPFGFAGGLHDRDTGLVRFGARDYDSQTGRFTTRDPILFAGGLNLYAYAGSDPVNNWDLDGAALDSVSATCARRPALCAIAFGGGSTVGPPAATVPVAGGGAIVCSAAEIGALGGVGVGVMGVGLAGLQSRASPVDYTGPRAPSIPGGGWRTPPAVICSLNRDRSLKSRVSCVYDCGSGFPVYIPNPTGDPASCPDAYIRGPFTF
jgi:RHS repeat-associated protein